MKKHLLFFTFFFIISYGARAQQIINLVIDLPAFAMRGVAIPGMLTAQIIQKNEMANKIIPAIKNEEEKLVRKWRASVLGTANVLNALAIASEILITNIEVKQTLIPIARYTPGLRKQLREFSSVRTRAQRLQTTLIALAGIGTFFIDGEGYYRVASQRLAIEYLEIYTHLSKLDFDLDKLIAFVLLLPSIAT